MVVYRRYDPKGNARSEQNGIGRMGEFFGTNVLPCSALYSGAMGGDWETGLEVINGSGLGASNFVTDSARLLIPSAFRTTELIPAAETTTGPAWYIVKSTIGVSGSLPFSIVATSIPFILGIRRSSTIRSGFSWLALS